MLDLSDKYYKHSTSSQADITERWNILMHSLPSHSSEKAREDAAIALAGVVQENHERQVGEMEG